MRWHKAMLLALAAAAPAFAQLPMDPTHMGAAPLVASPLPPSPADPATAALPIELGDVPADAAVQRAVFVASYAYLAARDSGHVDAAYAMIAPSMRTYLTRELYASQVTPFNHEAGAVQQRLVTRITWYRDPPDAPAPGLYAAADFVARFPNLYLHCGYLMWHQEPGGGWKLAREEQSFIDLPTAQDMPPEQRESTRRQMGCVQPAQP